MKHLLSIGTRALSAGALAFTLAMNPVFADEAASAGNKIGEFTYDGSNPSQQLVLQDTESHTVYESQPYESTCTRTVQVGTRTECSTSYRQECESTSRYECSTRYRQDCTNRPVCRQVPRQVCRTHESGREVCNVYYENECNYEYECTNIPEQDCRYVPDTVCHSVPETNCYEVPNYVTETYSCTKYHNVPVGTEVDFYVNANVAVNFSELPEGVRAEEKLAVKLDGDQLSFEKVKLSNELLLFVDQKIATSVEPQKIKKINASYQVNTLARKQVADQVDAGIRGLRLDGNLVKFTVNKVVTPELLSLNLKIIRSRQILGDKLVFDASLAKDAFSFSDAANARETEVTVDLSKLTLKEALRKAKYKFAVNLNLNPARLPKLLNPESLPAAKSARAEAMIDVVR